MSPFFYCIAIAFLSVIYNFQSGFPKFNKLTSKLCATKLVKAAIHTTPIHYKKMYLSLFFRK